MKYLLLFLSYSLAYSAQVPLLYSDGKMIGFGATAGTLTNALMISDGVLGNTVAQSADTGNGSFGISTEIYTGLRFVASNSFILTNISLYLKKGVNGTNAVSLYVYNDVSYLPSNPIGQSTTILTVADLPTAYFLTNKFTGINAPLTNNSGYWIVLKLVGVFTAGGMTVEEATVAGGVRAASADGSSWLSGSNNLSARYIMYKP